MAVFERSSVIHAPLDEVWRVHATVDGLEDVTPDWFDLQVESVVGPSGEPHRGELVEGCEVTLSVRPFGIGPRRSWTSHITHHERGDDRAEFRDVMADGPFRRWRHTHRFVAVPAGTRLTDRVEYQLRLGPARGLSALAWPGFAAVFDYRHRRAKRLLE